MRSLGSPELGISVRYLASMSAQSMPSAAEPFGRNTVLVGLRPSVLSADLDRSRLELPNERLRPWYGRVDHDSRVRSRMQA